MKNILKSKNIRELLTRKECISIIMILLFFAIALYSMFISPMLHQLGMNEGDIALKNVYAPYDFTYLWGIDDEKTEKIKEEAARSVPYSSRRNFAAENQIESGIGYFFDTLAKEKAREVDLSEKITSLKEITGENLSDKQLKLLLGYDQQEELKNKAESIIRAIFLSGYLKEEDYVFLIKNEVQNAVIFDEVSGTETEKGINELISRDALETKMEDLASNKFEKDRKIRPAVIAVINEYISPNFVLNKEKTFSNIDEAVKAVQPVLNRWVVEKNELIVEKGKRVNSRHVSQLAQLRRIFKPGTKPTFFFGVLLLFFLLGLVAAIYTSFVQKTHSLSDTKNLAIILINYAGLLIVADFIVRSPFPSYFIPLSSVGMMLMLIVGFNAAFISVFLMSILISIIVGGGTELMLVLVVGATVGIYAVREARRRTRILGAGVVAGLGKFFAIVCIGLVNGMDIDFYFKDGLWGLASGIFSAFIVMGLLPVFEYLFKVSTNISLLELSDLNHPLLKKLAVEAPGTYHHSIMVGNLAESACDAIGANSLKARVGAYYHDIGKIPKAEYFTENELGAGSRHSNLTPSMSALIISNHVKEGIDMARKYKLNSSIVDFISQHHGDSLIAYFYQKALEKSEDGIVAEEENFKYPGPRPQTKESAIILLSDAVEASSRALSEPTPSSIRNLVKKIINNKFIDGQLDECDLTLQDMHKIAASFVRVLTGVFHTRLDYPEKNKKEGSNGVPLNDDNDKQQKPKQKKKD